MIKKSKQMIAFSMITCLVSVGVSPTVFASEKSTYINTTSLNSKISKDTYIDKKLDVEFERLIEDSKTTVIIKSLDGGIINTLVKNNGITYLDGKELFVEEHNIIKSEVKLSNSWDRISRAISWGPWQYNSMNISTGGLSTTVIAGLIALNVGWTPLGIAATIAAAVAGKYDKITVKYKIRYGGDGRYTYYERETTFYGDGKFISVPGNPFKDSGKRY